jgi:phage shock protein PspC (stress-responsive transcriptional regulator)
MKKIININLSGRVIPIEDTAYEKLQAYIESLRRYFANEEGRDEIINDIESRIAELMDEKIKRGAAAVTEDDVNEIIASMGTVEDFAASDKEEDASTAPQANTQSSGTYTKSKRLFRNSQDKILGGVCSGIASYLNLDPTVVRILFAIITFGGFGLGLLVYILLWIILPPNDNLVYTGKRLYRNPDNRIIGGVAGGLAAYFNKSANLIRLIFVAPILIRLFISIVEAIFNHGYWVQSHHYFVNFGFGSLSGIFILTYIILWIAMPEALSEYQKMEMHGETVDINRIRQNVKEGMENMKSKMQDWGQEVKETAQSMGTRSQEFAAKGKSMAKEFNEAARRHTGGIAHVFGVLFKAFFLFIAGSIAFGLFVALIGLIFGGFAWWPFNHFLWTSQWQETLAWSSLILFLGVPFVAFLVWLIRRLMRVRSKNNYLGWTFGGLWAIGWVALILFAISITQDFRYYENVSAQVTVSPEMKDKMIVEISQPKLNYRGSFGWMHMNEDGWKITDDTFRFSAVKFNVSLSPDAQYHVAIQKNSFGRTAEEAMNRAGEIAFKASSKDSIIDLENSVAITSISKYRGQNVEMNIQVPPGKKIRFDESVEKMHTMNVRIKRGHFRERVNDVEITIHDYRDYKPNTDYIMGADGILRYADASLYKTNENIKAENPDSTELQEQINEEKKNLQDAEKKIKDLEQKQKDAQKKSTTLVRDTRRQQGWASAPVPEFSVLQYL